MLLGVEGGGIFKEKELLLENLDSGKVKKNLLNHIFPANTFKIFYLLSWMQSSAHNPSENMETSCILSRVLFGGVYHESTILVTGHHILVPLRFVGSAVDLINLHLHNIQHNYNQIIIKIEKRFT